MKQEFNKAGKTTRLEALSIEFATTYDQEIESRKLRRVGGTHGRDKKYIQNFSRDDTAVPRTMFYDAFRPVEISNLMRTEGEKGTIT